MLERSSRSAGYSRRLEMQLFARWRRRRPLYGQMCRRMVYALTHNRDYLLAHFEAAELLDLDHAVLGHGTAVERWHAEYRRRREEERELYSGSIPDTTDDSQKDVEGIVRCSRCKSSEVIWDQKQTRGADESMTVFFECKSCGKRWKMS